MATKNSPNARQAKARAVAAQQRSGGNKIIIGTVAAILAIVAVVAGVVWQKQSALNDAAGGGTATPANTKMGEGYVAYPAVKLVDKAPTLDLYEDFQCPACQQFEQILGPTIKTLGESGKAKVVYHVKNFLDDNLRNDASTRAAVGAFCAADDGKFLAYHDIVYANQPATEGDGWTDDQLAGFAQQAGVTGDKLATWKTCLEVGRYKAYVTSVEKQSFADKVKGTPTVGINGTLVKLADISTPEKLTAAIAAATK